jgi:dTDP-4-dehydrorhamnose reductase
VRRARAGERLEAVADKWSKPTSAAAISRGVEILWERGREGGVLHLVNGGGPESWWSYACKVLRMAHEAGLLAEVPPVAKTSLAEIPQLSAPRPVHTALGSCRQAEVLGAPLPCWEAAAGLWLREWARRESH